MEKVQSDRSRLSALGARQTPDMSLALSSSRLGGIGRDVHHEPILQSTASSAQPGLAPTQPWNTFGTTTHRGPRSSKMPSKNMYGSLSSAIGPSKESSHVNYTVSEDATESNLLYKLSKMLAILDESMLVHLLVITNTQAYEGEPNDQTPNDITPTKRVIMPDIPHISHGSSNSPGLGYPLEVGEVAEALRSASVARKQIAKINAEFTSRVKTDHLGLTKRQMWYDLASRHPVIDEERIRSAAGDLLKSGTFKGAGLYLRTDYLNTISHVLYGASAFGEVTRMYGVLGGPMLVTVQVSDLRRAIALCDDRANLEQVIQSIDREKRGLINVSTWIHYMHSLWG